MLNQFSEPSKYSPEHAVYPQGVRKQEIVAKLEARRVILVIYRDGSSSHLGMGVQSSPVQYTPPRPVRPVPVESPGSSGCEKATRVAFKGSTRSCDRSVNLSHQTCRGPEQGLIQRLPTADGSPPVNTLNLHEFIPLRARRVTSRLRG